MEDRKAFEYTLALFGKEIGYDELLEKESDFGIHFIDEKDIPAEITGAQMGMIFSMVREVAPEDIPERQKL